MSVLALELVKMLEDRIQTTQSERNALKEQIDVLDAKLKKLISAIGKRPTHTENELNELARHKEFIHSTTNMSLMQEKEFLRELEGIRQKKKDLVEYNKRQAEIEALKSTRTGLANELREKDELLDELFTGSRKLSVGTTLKCNPAEVVEKKITVPEDNISRIIGKGGSNIKVMEDTYSVVIFSERAHVLRIMGLEDNVSSAYSAILVQANAVTETINLHPALKACLMIGKANITKNIQEKHDVRINFVKTDNSCRIYGQQPNVMAAKEEILAVPFSKIKLHLDPGVIPKLVGKGGANLRSMYDDNLLQLDLSKDDNVLTIYGLQKDASPVAEAIKAFCEDNKEAHEVLTVSSFLLHNCVQAFGTIQVKGAYIDCAFGKGDEDGSVTVRGAKAAVILALEGVRKIIDEFQGSALIVEYHPSMIPSIIGRKGETINKLRQDNPGVNISISGNTVAIHSADKVARDSVKQAIDSIANSNYSESVALDKEAAITLRSQIGAGTRNELIGDLNLGLSIDVENESVRLIGRQEDVLSGKEILKNFAKNAFTAELEISPEDGNTVSSLISEFEKSFSVHIALINKRQNIRFTGTKENCGKAKKALTNILEGKKGSGSELVPVESSDFTTLIGARGRNLDALEKQFDVKIDILKAKDAVRIRGSQMNIDSAKVGIHRVISENVKTSISVPFSSNLSVEVVTRCMNEISKLYGNEVTVRSQEKVFTLKGRKELIDTARGLILELTEGTISDIVPLVINHGAALIPSRFSGIAESHGVSIRLDLQNNALVVSGLPSTIREAVEEVYSILHIMFPLMYELKSVPFHSLPDLASFLVLGGIEKECGVNIHVDRFLCKFCLRGDAEGIQKGLQIISEKLNSWESTHTVIDGLEENSIISLVAKQGEMLGAIERETSTSLRVNRNFRSVLIEGSTKEDMENAKAAILSRLKSNNGADLSCWEAVIHKDVVGSIIGKQGIIIKGLRAETGATIDFDHDASLIKVCTICAFLMYA